MNRIVKCCLAVALVFAVAGCSRCIVDGGHKGVQLWEGGPYWAETNIGAENPWDYGFYFWWGDTIGYKRVNDAWVASDGSSSGFSFEPENTLTWVKNERVLRKEGWITAGGVLAPKHDAAHVDWGGNWRMPTDEELNDLREKCDWEFGALKDIKGYFVRGKGDYASARIFLPCAGIGDGTSLYYAGSDGYCWSSVSDSDYDYSWCLRFSSSFLGTRRSYRLDGYPVRPVQGFTK